MERYRNKDVNPTEVESYPWLIEMDDVIYKQYDMENVGKWLLFYPKSKINEMWQYIRELYNNYQLDGVAYVKVSTNYKSERASSDQIAVIAFYCDNSDDKETILQIGRDIAHICHYTDSYGFMYYKTEKQSVIGTSSLGCKKNHKYTIAVPRK